MSGIDRLSTSVDRDLFILEDESDPIGSKGEKVHPSTTLDQVFDQNSPVRKNLRTILNELHQDIITGGKGNIVFPVTSVNNKTGDVIICKNDIGLGRVDNTADIDKPLSTPQRETIMSILKEYDFNVNLKDLYDHEKDMNNPHDVNISQINKDNALTDFINHLISLHNYSGDNTVHMDIRRSLMKLWSLVDDINNGLDDRLANVLYCMDEHLQDKNAHFDIFETKEDVSNKIHEFSKLSNNNHTKYPSVKAVIEFVENTLSDFRDTLTDVQNWIDDIQIVDTRANLPKATSKYHRKAYLIRYGYDSHSELAICRLNPDESYSWDITSTSIISKFNSNHFKDTEDGLTIKVKELTKEILETDGTLDQTLSEELSKYYTKDQIDDMHLVNRITILPGTMDGYIRYYINDDMSTMSEDVRIPGLQTLAYMNHVTENEIWDNSIFSRHIVSKAIETRHLQDESVTTDKISCRNGFLIGNTDNPGTTTSHEVSLIELADTLRPLIGGWPDPNTPGGNPWYNMISDQIMHPHLMVTGVEYSYGDKSYAQRFTGTINCIPNMDLKTLISKEITIGNGYRIIDAGGSWEYQTNPKEWTVLTGSNITGHTFGTVTMTEDALYFESISIGDRMNAPYDIWVKYIKIDEIENAQPM